MLRPLARGLAALVLLTLADVRPLPAGELRAGTGEALFDLPAGVSLAGYGGGGRRRPLIRCRRANPYAHLFKPSRGELDPVGSRAIVLEHAGRRFAFVATDLVGVSPEMHGDVAARLADLGIAPGDLFLAATHTHSGPAGFARARIWQLAAADKFVGTLYDRYLDSMAAAARAAAAALEPAELGIGAGTIEGVSYNRRDEANPLDPGATLIRFDSAAGRPLATLIVFPIHPTVLTGENLLLSGDVAGAVVRGLERETGATAVFFNGAEGDVGPLSEGRDAAAVERLGERIAARALEIWGEIEPGPVARIETAHRVREIGQPVLNLAACLGWKKRRWSRKLRSPLIPRQAPIGALRIDDHAFVAIPGELIAELGLAIKRRGGELGLASTSILGLTNGHLGYILTADEYGQRGYEVCASWYGPGLGDEILAGAGEALAAVSGPGRTRGQKDDRP